MGVEATNLVHESGSSRKRDPPFDSTRSSFGESGRGGSGARVHNHDDTQVGSRNFVLRVTYRTAGAVWPGPKKTSTRIEASIFVLWTCRAMWVVWPTSVTGRTDKALFVWASSAESVDLILLRKCGRDCVEKPVLPRSSSETRTIFSSPVSLCCSTPPLPQETSPRVRNQFKIKQSQPPFGLLQTNRAVDEGLELLNAIRGSFGYAS